MGRCHGVVFRRGVQIGEVELGDPFGYGVYQSGTGTEVVRRAAFGYASLAVHSGVTEALGAVIGQQLDRGIAEVSAPLLHIG